MWRRYSRPATVVVACAALVATVLGALVVQQLMRTSTPGATAHPDPFHIVALGDSMTFGSNCPCPPFAERFGQATSERLGVTATVANLAVPGITSEMLLTMLRTGDREATLRVAGIDPTSQPFYEVRAVIAAADIVLVEIGANDFLQQCAGGQADCAGTMRSASSNMSALLDEIAAMQGTHPHAVRLIGYYDFCRVDGRAGPSFDSDRCSDYLVALNAANSAVAGAKGSTFVDLVAAFNGADGTRDPGDLLSDDHVHASDSGHQLIADVLAGLGWDLPTR